MIIPAMLRSVFRLAMLPLLLPVLACAQSDDPRVAFATAYAAPSATAADDSAALRAYPLYPWLQAARLKVALEFADPDGLAQTEAIAFVDAAGEVAHVRDLRRALLTAAAERGDHTQFLSLWRNNVANETLRCQRLDARRASGDTATLATEIAERWVSEAVLPEACNGALAWLKTQALYTPPLIERRLRTRLLDGDVSRARELIAALPAERQARYQAWLRQLGSPAEEFKTLARSAPQLLDSEGLADTWSRWARKSSVDAAALLDALASAQKLSPAQKQTLQRDTALALAWSREPAAVALFKQVPEALQDERSYEWRVRAALWAGDWNQAFNWLALLPENLSSQPRWRYWNARALEALGQKTEALERYRALMLENDPYGLLAAGRAGKGWTPIDEPKPVTQGQRSALDATPAFARAREAWQADFKSIASLEWADAINTVPAAAQTALIREAAALGWHDQAIVTATRLGQFRDLDVLFPRPYPELATPAAAAADIPLSWLYSVMRKESAFKPDATSSAGAIGLLQMLPGTAVMTAKAAGRPVPTAEQLEDPRINLPLGALHLRELLDKSERQWPLVLASYNAGFRAMSRWRPPARMDADIWIENIPFNETRTYVQRILFHVGVYQWLATQKPVRPNGWLLPVEPLPAATP